MLSGAGYATPVRFGDADGVEGKVNTSKSYFLKSSMCFVCPFLLTVLCAVFDAYRACVLSWSCAVVICGFRQYPMFG